MILIHKKTPTWLHFQQFSHRGLGQSLVNLITKLQFPSMMVSLNVSPFHCVFFTVSGPDRLFSLILSCCFTAST